MIKSRREKHQKPDRRVLLYIFFTTLFHRQHEFIASLISKFLDSSTCPVGESVAGDVNVDETISDNDTDSENETDADDEDDDFEQINKEDVQDYQEEQASAGVKDAEPKLEA